MPTRAFLFDYGGTLDGEGSHWFDRMVELHRRSGSDVPREELRRAFYVADARLGEEAGSRRYGLRALVERHVAIQVEEIGDPARRVAEAVVEGFVAASEAGWRAARDVLGRLRGRARLGVVSNFYGNLEVQLEEAGLAPFLEIVVESARVGVAKPDPSIYQLALDRLRLPASDVVMVGDNFDRDVRPAKRLGLGTIWLRRGDESPPEPGLADRVVNRLAEIL